MGGHNPPSFYVAIRNRCVGPQPIANRVPKPNIKSLSPFGILKTFYYLISSVCQAYGDEIPRAGHTIFLTTVRPTVASSPDTSYNGAGYHCCLYYSDNCFGDVVCRSLRRAGSFHLRDVKSVALRPVTRRESKISPPHHLTQPPTCSNFLFILF